MAEQLGPIRNDVGTGHGRAAPVDVTLDEVTLVIDGSLTWVRWALRRLSPFCIGRPQQIIDQLEQGTWSKHVLRERLSALDMSSPHIASQVGLAVGRRAARDTFTVIEDGIESPAASNDLVRWPPAYRIAAATGLLGTAAGVSTVSANRLRLAIELVRPLRTRDIAGPPTSDSWESLSQFIGSVASPISGDAAAISALRSTLQCIADEEHPLADPARRLLGTSFSHP